MLLMSYAMQIHRRNGTRSIALWGERQNLENRGAEGSGEIFGSMVLSEFDDLAQCIFQVLVRKGKGETVGSWFLAPGFWLLAPGVLPALP